MLTPSCVRALRQALDWAARRRYHAPKSTTQGIAMQERVTLESLSERVESLEQFVRDMRDASETMKLLAAQHARELESVVVALAEQIRERSETLIGAPKAN
jgi:cell division protein FtsB